MHYPNLYIVGLPKAGTTSLHDLLLQHPDIAGSPDFKDYLFFNDVLRLKDIKQLVAYHKQENYLLDSGATYSFYPETVERIKHFVPDAKLILIVRNPIDRTLSDYYFRRKYGRISLRESEVLNSSDKRASLGTLHQLSLFGQQISTLLEHFPKEQLKIMCFEALIRQQKEALDDLYNFLEIPSISVSLTHKNKTGGSKIPALTRLVRGRSNLKKTVAGLLPKSFRRQLAERIVTANTTNVKAERKLYQLKEEMEGWYREDLELATQLSEIDFLKKYGN